STVLGLARPRQQRKYRPLPANGPMPVPWVTGCGLLIRRDCLRELGGFDEQFFLYYEDVDLCRRARAKRWSVWYEPELLLVDRQPLHARSVPAYLRSITRHALLTYASKHWPRWQFWLLARLVQLEAGFRQFLANRRGNRTSAKRFAELRRIAAHSARGQSVSAHRLLNRLVRRSQAQAEEDMAALDARPPPPQPLPPEAGARGFQTAGEAACRRSFPS